jgi:hypothetical protein
VHWRLVVRMFDAVLHGMPPHTAQLIAGHRDINTTMGYKAVYPDEVINGTARSSPAVESYAPATNTAHPPNGNGRSSSATSNDADSPSTPAAAPAAPHASTSTPACAARCYAQTPHNEPD